MNGRKSKDGPASSPPGGQRASRPQSAARRSSLPREPAPRVPSSGSAIARLRLGALSRRRGERWKWWWQLELECWSSGKAAASAPPGRLRTGWLGERRGGGLRAPLHVRGAAPRAWRRRAEGAGGGAQPHSRQLEFLPEPAMEPSVRTSRELEENPSNHVVQQMEKLSFRDGRISRSNSE